MKGKLPSNADKNSIRTHINMLMTILEPNYSSASRRNFVSKTKTQSDMRSLIHTQKRHFVNV